MKKCLVTGGAGFIGSNLVERLVGLSFEVKVLDDLSSGFLRNLEPFRENIEFIEGDVRDMATLQQVMSEVEVVFHQAAVVSVPQSIEDPMETGMVNDLGTLYVLEAARHNGVRRVVFASSCAVYGDLPQVPKKEDMDTKPLSPYAASKLNGETYARLYGDLYGLETVCLRYFNVYGPRQDPSSPYSGVISIFMDSAARGERPTIYGDGEQYRDFVYVADVVQANLLAAQRENISGVTINVGTGKPVTINSLWRNIAELAGVQGEAKRADFRPGDIRQSVAEISRARELLDYQSYHSLEEGLQFTWEWYRSRSY
ncbi:MAG: SDR family oxidoreductase [Deltaproteobacteria bacterium]|nr:SDR family oxidoreductase [Deltaproteobacteria bacterium]